MTISRRPSPDVPTGDRAARKLLESRLTLPLAVIGAIASVADMSGSLRSRSFWAILLFICGASVIVLWLWGWRKGAMAAAGGSAASLVGLVFAMTVGAAIEPVKCESSEPTGPAAVVVEDSSDITIEDSVIDGGMYSSCSDRILVDGTTVTK